MISTCQAPVDPEISLPNFYPTTGRSALASNFRRHSLGPCQPVWPRNLFTFPPSLLDLVHQTHPNTVADCLLWPPPLLCHCLQWITQFFFPPTFLPSHVVITADNSMETRTTCHRSKYASKADRQPSDLQPLLSLYLISQSHLALYKRFSPHFLTLFLKD